MSPFLNFSLIQTALHWENKAKNMQLFEGLLAQVPKESHVIILPEMFSTGFSMHAVQLAESMGGTTVQWLKAVASQYKKIITGSLIIKEDGKFYNRLIWMQPDGNYYYYDKAHLFSKAGEDRFYSAGNKKLIVQVNGWKIQLQICYDLRFPVWARQARESYDVLINVANWPEVRLDAWNTLLKARAIENQAYVLGVNVTGEDGNNIYYSGNSSAYDFSGQSLWTLANSEGIGNVRLSRQELEQFRKDFPFLNDRDEYLIL